MQANFKLFSLFKKGNGEFKPYYQKENSFRRLVVIHSIAAFIISPIYCIFIYQTDIPKIYFYLGLAYTLLFPVYMLLCGLIKYFNDKLIYFFIAHLFGITLFAYRSLLQNGFEIQELFCFYALYSVIIVVIQRWYPAVLYNVFVIILMIYGFQTIETDAISINLVFGLFVVLSLSSTVVLFSRQRMINAVEDYSQYLKRIMNNPGSGFILFNTESDNLKVVDFNDEASRELNVKYSDFTAIEKRFFNFLNQEERAKIIKLKPGDKYTKTISYHKFNEKHFIEFSIIVLSLKNGNYWLVRINDVTESILKREEIELNRRNLENILDNNPEGILIVRESQILYKNTELENILGKKFHLSKLFTQKDQKRFDDLFSLQIKSNLRQNIQLEILGTNNERISVDVTLVSTTYEEVDATLIIIKDISVQNTLAKEKLRAELAEETNKKLADEIKERINAERLVKEQFLRTKAILDSSSNTFLLTLTLDQKISSFNTHFESYFYKRFNVNTKEGETFDSFCQSVFTPARLRFFKIILNQVTQGKSYQFEVKVERNNIEVWLEVFVNPIFDTRGEVAEISLVAHDVSDKRKSNMEIIESLKEKEVLLKEIHHRVKNNLQVISSILNLQSSFVKDENTLGILQESRNRIRSMAIIHENLYRTEDFSSINFADYLQNLTANLIATYRIHDQVILNSDLDNIDLILDQAIPCGLLVNELITNSLKYAWRSGEKGTITMELKEEKGFVQLFIGDNGVGLPAKFEDINSDTLGLQLVVTLVEQLDGELAVDSDNGTKYLIKFENIKSTQNVQN